MNQLHTKADTNNISILHYEPLVFKITSSRYFFLTNYGSYRATETPCLR